MESIDTTGKALVDHWKWAADKGLMNPNTAGAWRAACTQVLSVMDDWEKLDVRAMNVDDICLRFQNKRSKDFKPDSLDSYKRRFRQAAASFLDHAKDPSSWKAPARDQSQRRDREKKAVTNGGGGTAAQESSAIDGPNPSHSIAGGLVEYPFPLRDGRFAYLKLPMDLNGADVKRLTAYLNALAIDEPTVP